MSHALGMNEQLGHRADITTQRTTTRLFVCMHVVCVVYVLFHSTSKLDLQIRLQKLVNTEHVVNILWELGQLQRLRPFTFTEAERWLLWGNYSYVTEYSMWHVEGGLGLQSV